MRQKQVFTDEERRKRNCIAVTRWRKNHPEKVAEYSRRYWQKKKESIDANKEKRRKCRKKRPLPTLDEVCALFKNPEAAAHVRWLAENRKKGR